MSDTHQPPMAADALLQRGQRLLQAGDRAGAAAALQQAREKVVAEIKLRILWDSFNDSGFQNIKENCNNKLNTLRE